MARLYCADVRGLDEGHAKRPGRTGAPGSAFAASLLGYAAGVCWGLAELPEIRTDGRGKPYFPAFADRHFSLSHTRTHILAALSDAPVGADIETRRDRPPGYYDKLMSERERADFDFFELWVLRESVFKLTGEGSLRDMRFARENGLIVPPVSGVRCRLYDVDGCAAALSCFEGELPDGVIFVPSSAICT